MVAQHQHYQDCSSRKINLHLASFFGQNKPIACMLLYQFNLCCCIFVSLVNSAGFTAYTMVINGGRSHYCAIDHTDSVIKASIIFCWRFTFFVFMFTLLLVFFLPRRFFPRKTDIHSCSQNSNQTVWQTRCVWSVGHARTPSYDVNRMQSANAGSVAKNSRTDRHVRHAMT